MIDGPTGRLLCNLADPDKPPAVVSDEALPMLADAALSHGVGAIVLRKLAGRGKTSALADLSGEIEIQTALTLHLRGLATAVEDFIAKEDLAAAIIKGPAFAGLLYRLPGDRPFTDLDILVRPGARDAIAGFLEARGLHRHRKARLDKSTENREEKWIHPEFPALLIELHGDLVHYAGLRRKVGFGYEQLMRAEPGNPRAPLALFFTAVVHAALGHKFHQLRLLVDVLQAYRNLGEDDRRALAPLAADLHLVPETVLCLQLAGELFEEKSAKDEAMRMGGGLAGRLGCRIVTPRSVLDAPYSPGSRIRRHAFRRLQHFAVRRGA